MNIEVTGIEAQICREIAARQAMGLKKYGTTLNDNPAQIVDRLQHLKEELLDATLYTQWAINRIKAMEDDQK